MRDFLAPEIKIKKFDVEDVLCESNIGNNDFIEEGKGTEDPGNLPSLNSTGVSAFE